MSFFRGVSASSDFRFGDASKATMKQMVKKAPKSFETKIHMSHVCKPLVASWVEQKLMELLGLEDEVVVGLVSSSLEAEVGNGLCCRRRRDLWTILPCSDDLLPVLRLCLHGTLWIGCFNLVLYIGNSWLPLSYMFSVVTNLGAPRICCDGVVHAAMQSPNPLELQLTLTGFLEKRAPAFVAELWDVLISAQVCSALCV